MDKACLYVFLVLKAIHLSWCLIINTTGQTYIEPGVPYTITCLVSEFKENRITIHKVTVLNEIQTFSIRYSTTAGCYYSDNGNKPCTENLCSCDTNGLATHLTYDTPSDLSSMIQFTCSSSDRNGVIVESTNTLVPTIPKGPGASMSFDPPLESITKVQSQSLGPINCSAQCNPKCWIYWIKPDSAVIAGSRLDIQRLSKIDDGTFVCHAGNGYGTNATKSLLVIVNYGPESLDLSPNNTKYNITEKSNIPAITCSAACKPQCNFSWSGPNVPDRTTNVLHLLNVNRSQDGQFSCNATNIVGSLTSSNVIVNVQFGPGSSISFNPQIEAITKVQGERLGPITCSAQCHPKCWFYWITPNNTVIAGSHLEMRNLSKMDHGPFLCHAGNGYGTNSTKSFQVTVNYGPESVVLSPNKTKYIVTENDNMPGITCSAACRPHCSFSWTGPNVPDGATNVLHLQNINRNRDGIFSCDATNIVGSVRSSNVTVVVQYGPGSSVSLDPALESITKVQGQSLGPINCSAQCNPRCWLYWIKPDSTEIVGSRLTIRSLLKIDHGTFVCHTGNGYGTNSTKSLHVTVNYDPESMSLSPSNTTYVVTENGNIPGITCRASCRPPCTFSWTGPNVPDGTRSMLNLQSIKRNQSGLFSCNATNYVGSLMSSNVEVDVQYTPDVTSLHINGTNNTIEEHSSITFTCAFDGNPKPVITWFVNDLTLEKTHVPSNTSVLIIESANCSNTGMYRCQLENIIGRSAKNQSLFVTCHPRSSKSLEESIAITEKISTLDIKVPVISYPKPALIKWSYSKNETWPSAPVEDRYISNVTGVFQHTTQLIIHNITDANYGTYTIKVYNNIEPAFKHVFKVKAETTPDSPSNVVASCEISPQSTRISWKSEFNGGRQQTFAVWWKIYGIKQEHFIRNVQLKADPGRNKNASITIDGLQPGTSYIFYINSSNINGWSISRHVYCNTSLDTTSTESDSSIIGVVAGTSSGLIIVVVVIALLVARRKLVLGKAKHDQSRSLTTGHGDYIDECGLKDNIMYESAGPTFNAKPATSGAEYAVVQNQRVQRRTCVDDKVKETALYAEVKKKPKKGLKGVKEKGKKPNHDDVYENVEKHDGHEQVKSKTTENRNKDGLQYADLVFKPLAHGAKFIIHGLEDRTIYAEVDTTQKIDPLPDSDNENETASTTPSTYSG